MAYERNMAIVYDPVEKWVVVSFRGTVKLLSGPFANRKEAVASAEAYCLGQGWVDEPRPSLFNAVRDVA